MPSDHVASAAITATGLAEIGPVYGALGWTYVGLTTVSVVYLREHYARDAQVGVPIHRYAGVVSPLVHRVVDPLDRSPRRY